jgi:hypothetical protein
LRCHYEGSADLPDDNDAATAYSPLRSITSHFGNWTSCIDNIYNLMGRMSQSCSTLVTTYFSTVHRWLPIIDEKCFLERLQRRSFESDTNDFLLLMSVYLIVQRPDAQPGQETMDDDLYHAVRHFYFDAFADIGSSPSIQLLQGGVLIATYEYGHGMMDAAYTTLCSCLSASTSLGLHQPPYSELKLGSGIQKEWTLVWWAIVICDRCVSLFFGRGRREPY